MLEHLFRRLRTMKPILLGRWCLNDKSKNNWKVDMANVDHCGTCSYVAPRTVPKIKDLEIQNPPPKKERGLS
jgi:hypothetical protein